MPTDMKDINDIEIKIDEVEDEDEKVETLEKLHECIDALLVRGAARVIVDLREGRAPEFYVIIGKLQDHRGDVYIAIDSDGRQKEFPKDDVDAGEGCDWFDNDIRQTLIDHHKAYEDKIFGREDK